MEENAASEVQGQQKSSGDNGKASEVKPNFFVTAAGTESLTLGSPDFDGSPEVEPLGQAAIRSTCRKFAEGERRPAVENGRARQAAHRGDRDPQEG